MSACSVSFGIGREVIPSHASVVLTLPPRLVTPAGAPLSPDAAKFWFCVVFAYDSLKDARVFSARS
ncbi:MAG: hypothetical protein BWX79_02931 [Alphaproteobacteria bacterium ADurb.Bin100]|nr:MAG: hypothetical protein BWX79_02931 [Alphaproteobacteria bacterium ADurb.Bin100]